MWANSRRRPRPSRKNRAFVKKHQRDTIAVPARHVEPDLAHSSSAHNMRNLSFLRGDGAGESQLAGWEIGRVFAERRVVEVPQDEAAESKWSKRRADWYSAILVLAKR